MRSEVKVIDNPKSRLLVEVVVVWWWLASLPFLVLTPLATLWQWLDSARRFGALNGLPHALEYAFLPLTIGLARWFLPPLLIAMALHLGAVFCWPRRLTTFGAGLAWCGFRRPVASATAGPRRWPRTLGVALLGVFAVALLAAVTAPEIGGGAVESRPNVLLISIDTLRADHLGSYGYARDTSPRIDQLARRGVLYEQAQSAAPWTLPAHASLFTGLDPSEHRLTEYSSAGDDWQVLDENLPLLAEELQQHGYATAAFTGGGLMGSRFGFARGFDRYRSEGRRLEDFQPQVLGWLERNRRWPFFLFLHFYNTHRPYQPPPPYDRMFAPPGAVPFSSAELDGFCGDAEQSGEPPPDPLLEQVVARYDGEIRHVDTLLGEIFDQLEAVGLDQNTLVVLLSDHGEAFFEHGNCDHLKSLYEPLLHVPLVVAGPGLPVDRQIEQPVQLKDVGQLILDYLGVATQLGSRPRRLLAELRRAPSGSTGPPALAYAETCCQGYERTAAGWRHQPWQSGIRSIRSAGFKLITDPQGEPIELYDLRHDPAEHHDLLGLEDPATKAAGHELQQAMTERLQRIDEHRSEWAPTSGRQPLDGETLRQLRQLGYID